MTRIWLRRATSSRDYGLLINKVDWRTNILRRAGCERSQDLELRALAEDFRYARL